MELPRRTGALLLAAFAILSGSPAGAVELPPTCLTDPAEPDTQTPLPELRARVESLAETDPTAVVRLLCATIPRVAREQGEDSVELAWWLGSLATPLIAYMDKHAEAMPLIAAARAIFERRLGQEAEPLADLYVADAWIAFRQGRLADSRDAWRRALAIRERFPGARRIELQKALVGLAHVQVSLREFAEARAALTRAQVLVAENGDAVSEAAAAIENAFTNLCLREEDYAGARAHAEAQIAIERQMSGGAVQLVPAYVLLGQALERLDAFDESETALREAIRLAESNEGPLQRHLLAARTQLGALLCDRGHPEQGLPFLRAALEQGEQTLGPEAPRLVRVLVLLAEAHRALGELPEALHLYERAAVLVEARPGDVERHTLVSFHRGLGSLLLALGDLERGRTSLEAGLAAAGSEPTLSTERAEVLLALARSHRASSPEGSRAGLQEALALFRTRLPDRHPTVLRVVNELCGLELDAGPAAAPHCEEARRRLEEGGEVEPSLRQAVEDNQSRLARARGDRAGAHAHAVRALAAAAALAGPDPSWRAHRRLSLLVDEEGDRPLAIFLGKQAIADVERLRGRFAGEDRRYAEGFLTDKADVYRTVADWLLESGRFEEGLEVLSLLKSEELYEFTLRGSSGDAPRLSLTKEEEALSSRWKALLAAEAASGEEIERLARLRDAGRITREETEALERLLTGQRDADAARAEGLGAFLSQAQIREEPGAGPARVPQVDRLRRELRRFPSGTALAVYLLTERSLRVLVATEAGQTETRIPVDARALGRDIGRFLDRMRAREDVSTAARALYATLAKDVDVAASRAGCKRLVLWLDGALRYVPFAALHDGERYLLDKYVLQSYSPGGAPAAPAGEAWSVRGLGVTRPVAGFRPLPGVADELCAIVRGPVAGLQPREACSGALRGEGFVDAAFTEARLTEPLRGHPGFSVLHLGTHFTLRPGNVLRSYLLLGDGGKLTLDRIGDLDFTGIELLTLSACQTGLSGASREDGREVEGLAAIVQRRGARRVVASLWQVEDQSTAELMQAFYRALPGSRGDVPRALQRAQRAARAGHAHPYFWAGFVLSAGLP
jgi:CHAT domain-containing protein